jgi:hypothetical protein
VWEDGTPAAGVVVVAQDITDNSRGTFVGNAATAADGRFSIGLRQRRVYHFPAVQPDETAADRPSARRNRILRSRATADRDPREVPAGPTPDAAAGDRQPETGNGSQVTGNRQLVRPTRATRCLKSRSPSHPSHTPNWLRGLAVSCQTPNQTGVRTV